jgi:hypothetical protein
VSSDLDLSGSSFDDSDIGSITVGDRLVLDGALFRARVQGDIDAGRLSCASTRFPAGGRFRVRRAEVNCDAADFPVPFVFTSWPSESGFGPVPRLISLGGANVAGLTIGSVDFSGCRLADAQNLDKLQIQSISSMARAPSYTRNTGRRALADEIDWRHLTGHRRWAQLAMVETKKAVPTAEAIASLYRSLRKSLEDAKNEPGAADFYYGEMEMRRYAAPRRSIERALLSLYWLVSGYGLRAGRALVALFLLLALGTAGFATVGFDRDSVLEYRPTSRDPVTAAAVYRVEALSGPRPGWAAAVDHSLESATSLLRGTQQRRLTPIGRAIELALRLVGPLLLGLAVLAVRGRVKR